MSLLSRARLLAAATAVVVALALVPPAAADDADPQPTPSETSIASPSPEPSDPPSSSPSAAPSPTPSVTTSPTPRPSPAVPAVTVYGYYSVPWSTTVYQSWTDGTVRALSDAAWRAKKAPKSPAPVRYVKAPWSASRYALVTFPHRAGDRAVDRVVTLSEARWRAAGKPRVSTLSHVPTTVYSRFASSSVDFYALTPDGVRTKITLSQYRAAGSPKARVVYGGFYRLRWSKEIRFVSSSGATRAVSTKQYAAAGKPRVAIAPTVYAKTSYSPVHALVTWPHSRGDRSVDQVVRLSAAQYKAAGSPRPEIRTRIPGDRFVRLSVGKTIFHLSKGRYTPVTTAQWRAAGAPAVGTVRPPKPTYIRGTLIVNKSLPLPADYGSGLRREVTSSFASMRAAARRDGVSLYIISGFRSYATQKSVYAAKIRQYGFATAEKRSARPGHSEHQSGLAIDVNSISQSWGETKAGRWVARNAHRYGFIVRYPKGKTKVTGYAYEPWHLRYVGTRVASHLYKTGLTLDEYLGVPSKY